MIVKKAYEAGARNVYVERNDNELLLIKFENAPLEAFREFPTWKAKGLVEPAKEGLQFCQYAHLILIYSGEAGLFK